MNLSLIDWRVLRGAMVLLLVSLLISGGLVFAAEWFNDTVQASFRQQQKNLVAVRSSYQQVDGEKLIMEAYLPLYGELVRAGVIGPEQRLTWVEALRGAAQELSLPSLRYEIRAQKQWQPQLPLEIGLHRIYRTEMTLDMGLFHEGDLPRVLQALESKSRGLFSVDECSLARNAPLFGMDPHRANMNAACVLHWFTLRLPDA